MTNVEVDKVIILGKNFTIARNDVDYIASGTYFIIQEEVEALNTFFGSYYDLKYIENRFCENYKQILTCGLPILEEFNNQINKSETIPDCLYEFHCVELSSYFKMYLVLCKTVLDKLIRIFSKRFNAQLPSFSDKGNRLINTIKQSKTIINKEKMLKLVISAKSEWIDMLIKMRDDYTHFSDLKQYRSFWITKEFIKYGINITMDMIREPIIILNNREIKAIEYIMKTGDQIKEFCYSFIQLCDFSNERRPGTVTKCQCGHIFAKIIGTTVIIFNDFEVQVTDRGKKIGRLICPKCGKKTQSDLSMYK